MNEINQEDMTDMSLPKEDFRMKVDPELLNAIKVDAYGQNKSMQDIVHEVLVTVYYGKIHTTRIQAERLLKSGILGNGGE